MPINIKRPEEVNPAGQNIKRPEVKPREYQHGTPLDDIVAGFKKYISPGLERKQAEKVATYGGYDKPIPESIPEFTGIMKQPLAQSKLTPDQSIQQVRDVAEQTPQMPEQDISSKIPGTDIATVEGWKPKQDVLPGNDFNKANTEDYFKQTGYIKDDDPRMIKRRQEAEDVQARRLKFIEDSEAGKFSSGSSPTIAGGLPVGGRGNGYTPVSNIGKKERIAGANRASVERIADTNARQRSQDNLARLASGNATQQETVGLPKSISRKDQVEGFNQAKAFGQEFTSKVVPGLPPIVGEEIFNLITPDMPLTRLQTVLDEELTKLKVDSKDADIVNDPAEIVSLLKSRIRNEQSR